MRRRWLAIGLLATGCPSPTTVQTSDVFTLTADPTAVADGMSPIAVQVCVTGDQARAAGLTATLTLSRGQWSTPTSSTSPLVYTGQLSGVACVDAVAIAPSDLAPLFITASVAGFTSNACVQMVPPALAFVELSAGPPSVTVGGDTTLSVTALPVASAGATVPSSTQVSFTVVPDPSDAGYALLPSQTTLTAAGAVTTIAVPAFVDAVTVTASAQVPAGPPCPSGTPGSPGTAASASVSIPLPLAATAEAGAAETGAAAGDASAD